MSVRAIVMHPDPVLRAPCDGVVPADVGALRGLIDDMLDTMYAAEGRGLAAPQVGQSLRVFVFDAEWKRAEPAPFVCINPVVVPVGDDVRTVEEQCLSIPDRPVSVERPAVVQMTFLDREGRAQERVFDGDAAVIVQHEADHLEGRLILDYVEESS